MKISKILIGIDDSKFAEHAAEIGFGMARLYQAEVGLINMVEPVTFSSGGNDVITGLPFGGNNIGDLEIINMQGEIAESIIERTIKQFAGDIPVTHFTDFGSTAEGIISCSAAFNADLIVIGTHSRTGIDRLLMGSVAEHVVRHSEVPVLVVPFKEGEVGD